ncbi:MAG TPA: aminopeptidase N C-terminal domain-containing protein, partial [Sphingomonas sp.]
RTLDDPALDAAFVGEAVLLPSESFLGDQLATVDPAAVRAAREALRRRLAHTHAAAWRAVYAACSADRYEQGPEAKGRRRLRGIALGYLAVGGGGDGLALALAQYRAADNMTDRQGALTVLANGDGAARDAALADFHERYRADALVLDKWFTTQAMSTREDTVDAVMALARHPDFTIANPNRLRALVGAFAANQYAFHAADGRGYRFVADMILAADRLNPQSAARLVPALGRWRRFEPARAALMRDALDWIVATPGLSKDVFEQASKSLA